MFNARIRNHLSEQVNYKNFEKNDFFIRVEEDIFKFEHKLHPNIFFSIDSTIVENYIEDPFDSPPREGHKIFRQPGAKMELEELFFPLESLPNAIKIWLDDVDPELDALEKQQWEEYISQRSEELKERFNHFHEDNEILNANSPLSYGEIINTENIVDKWKEDVETNLKEIYTHIGSLQEQIDYLKNQLELTKKDAKSQTRKNYTFNIFNRMAMLLLYYPELSEYLLGITASLLPIEYKNSSFKNILNLPNNSYEEIESE